MMACATAFRVPRGNASVFFPPKATTDSREAR